MFIKLLSLSAVAQGLLAHLCNSKNWLTLDEPVFDT